MSVHSVYKEGAGVKTPKSCPRGFRMVPYFYIYYLTSRISMNKTYCCGTVARRVKKESVFGKLGQSRSIFKRSVGLSSWFCHFYAKIEVPCRTNNGTIYKKISKTFWRALVFFLSGPRDVSQNGWLVKCCLWGRS